MECMHCRGRMLRATAPFTIDRAGYHIRWDKVPAWVCSQCGEAYFEARDVEVIQQALADLDRDTARLESTA